MVIITNILSDPQEFTVYKNYIVALDLLIRKLFKDDYRLLRDSFNKRLNNVDCSNDLDILRKLLYNAWNTEVLLNLPSRFDNQYIRLTNHWAPVQGYYVLYLLLRALIIAKGMRPKAEHRKILNIVANNLLSQEKIFPNPWGICCSEDCDIPKYTNLPAEYIPTTICSLSNPMLFNDNDLYSSLCMLLRTTRERILEQRGNDWKQKNPTTRGPRKNLPRGVKETLDHNLPPTSVFDAFYRLRTRSNYRDADAFLLTVNENSSRLFFNSLTNVIDKTAFMIEQLIVDLTTKTTFSKLTDAYFSIGDKDLLSKMPFGIYKRHQHFN
ncbi:MAG: hypothetical protein WC529_01305 [Candidatus Margulisiibacteriota bacterium]